MPLDAAGTDADIVLCYLIKDHHDLKPFQLRTGNKPYRKALPHGRTT